jgi:hypothetical protein
MSRHEGAFAHRQYPKLSLDWADRAVLVAVIKILPHALGVRRLVATTTVCARHPVVGRRPMRCPASRSRAHMDDLPRASDVRAIVGELWCVPVSDDMCL